MSYTPGRDEFRDWLKSILKNGIPPRSATECLKRVDDFERLVKRSKARAWDEGYEEAHGYVDDWQKVTNPYHEEPQP